jgi:hypothetical protein
VDVSDAFRSLPDDERRLADRFAVISGLVPAAIAISRLSRTDSSAAATAASRVGGSCRELAEAEPGDSELWQVAAELFALAADGHATIGRVETLLRWYPAPGAVNRLVLVPYFEAYWRFAARNSRFAFRAPSVTAAAIESALDAPGRERLYAVLSAAAGGFSMRGAREVLQRLRDAIPRESTK